MATNNRGQKLLNANVSLGDTSSSSSRKLGQSGDPPRGGSAVVIPAKKSTTQKRYPSPASSATRPSSSSSSSSFATNTAAVLNGNPQDSNYNKAQSAKGFVLSTLSMTTTTSKPDLQEKDKEYQRNLKRTKFDDAAYAKSNDSAPALLKSKSAQPTSSSSDKAKVNIKQANNKASSSSRILENDVDGSSDGESSDGKVVALGKRNFSNKDRSVVKKPGSRELAGLDIDRNGIAAGKNSNSSSSSLSAQKHVPNGKTPGSRELKSLGIVKGTKSTMPSNSSSSDDDESSESESPLEEVVGKNKSASNRYKYNYPVKANTSNQYKVGNKELRALGIVEKAEADVSSEVESSYESSAEEEIVEKRALGKNKSTSAPSPPSNKGTKLLTARELARSDVNSKGAAPTNTKLGPKMKVFVSADGVVTKKPVSRELRGLDIDMKRVAKPVLAIDDVSSEESAQESSENESLGAEKKRSKHDLSSSRVSGNSNQGDISKSSKISSRELKSLGFDAHSKVNQGSSSTDIAKNVHVLDSTNVSNTNKEKLVVKRPGSRELAGLSIDRQSFTPAVVGNREIRALNFHPENVHLRSKFATSSGSTVLPLDESALSPRSGSNVLVTNSSQENASAGGAAAVERDGTPGGRDVQVRLSSGLGRPGRPPAHKRTTSFPPADKPSANIQTRRTAEELKEIERQIAQIDQAVEEKKKKVGLGSESNSNEAGAPDYVDARLSKRRSNERLISLKASSNARAPSHKLFNMISSTVNTSSANQTASEEDLYKTADAYSQGMDRSALADDDVESDLDSVVSVGVNSGAAAAYRNADGNRDQSVEEDGEKGDLTGNRKRKTRKEKAKDKYSERQKAIEYSTTPNPVGTLQSKRVKKPSAKAVEGSEYFLQQTLQYPIGNTNSLKGGRYSYSDRMSMTNGYDYNDEEQEGEVEEEDEEDEYYVEQQQLQQQQQRPERSPRYQPTGKPRGRPPRQPVASAVHGRSAPGMAYPITFPINPVGVNRTMPSHLSHVNPNYSQGMSGGPYAGADMYSMAQANANRMNVNPGMAPHLNPLNPNYNPNPNPNPLGVRSQSSKAVRAPSRPSVRKDATLGPPANALNPNFNPGMHSSDPRFNPYYNPNLASSGGHFQQQNYNYSSNSAPNYDPNYNQNYSPRMVPGSKSGRGNSLDMLSETADIQRHDSSSSSNSYGSIVEGPSSRADNSSSSSGLDLLFNSAGLGSGMPIDDHLGGNQLGHYGISNDDQGNQGVVGDLHTMVCKDIRDKGILFNTQSPTAELESLRATQCPRCLKHFIISEISLHIAMNVCAYENSDSNAQEGSEAEQFSMFLVCRKLASLYNSLLIDIIDAKPEIGVHFRVLLEVLYILDPNAQNEKVGVRRAMETVSDYTNRVKSRVLRVVAHLQANYFKKVLQLQPLQYPDLSQTSASQRRGSEAAGSNAPEVSPRITNTKQQQVAQVTQALMAVRPLSSFLPNSDWVPEEEEYFQKLIQTFLAGLLDIPPETNLLDFLAAKLHCEPEKVTRRFGEESPLLKKDYAPVKLRGKDARQTHKDNINKTRRILSELEAKFYAKKGFTTVEPSFPIASFVSGGTVTHLSVLPGSDGSIPAGSTSTTTTIAAPSFTAASPPSSFRVIQSSSFKFPELSSYKATTLQPNLSAFAMLSKSAAASTTGDEAPIQVAKEPSPVERTRNPQPPPEPEAHPSYSRPSMSAFAMAAKQSSAFDKKPEEEKENEPDGNANTATSADMDTDTTAAVAISTTTNAFITATTPDDNNGISNVDCGSEVVGDSMDEGNQDDDDEDEDDDDDDDDEEEEEDNRVDRMIYLDGGSLVYHDNFEVVGNHDHGEEDSGEVEEDSDEVDEE